MFLVILRTPFLPLGILSGSSSLVPYAGPVVAGATVTVFVLVTGAPGRRSRRLAGAVLAVPVAAAAQIVMREVLATRWTREGQGGPGASPR